MEKAFIHATYRIKPMLCLSNYPVSWSITRRQSLLIDLEERIATAAEKAPTDDLQQALRSAIETVKDEFNLVVNEGNMCPRGRRFHVIGTERHESRRVDNQLRGRAGRQGDPGSTRFFLSLEDNLLRIFGGELRQPRCLPC